MSHRLPRRVRLALFAFFALIPLPAAARDLAGRYRLAEGPDVAGQLELTSDGRFGYALAAGALDERAQGRWEARDGKACLTTEPTPTPAELKPTPAPADQAATVRVTWPSGGGVPGVRFTIDFAEGEPVEGYTQEGGWTLPAGETRTPKWIAMLEPIYRTPLARTPFAATGRFHAVLVPHDMGVVDFRQACLEPRGEIYVLHRTDASGTAGEMKFRRAER